MCCNGLGKRISECRKTAGFKQTEVAEKLHVQREVISYYENGKRTPNIEDLYIMAELFGVSLDYLTGRTDIKTIAADIRVICEHTGLSEKAVELLSGDSFVGVSGFINALLECQNLNWMLDSYYEYLKIVNEPEVYFREVLNFENSTREIQNPLTIDITGRHNAEEYAVFKFERSMADFIESMKR